MAEVHFTSHLQKFADCDAVSVAGATVGEALAAALDGRDRLRSYVLDEQGRLRRHVAVWVDGRLIADRLGMTDPVGDTSEVYIMQALSGG